MAQTRLDRNEQINGWAFVMPALVLLGIFMIYPILWSLWMSFQVGRGNNFSFGGLANIQRLANDALLVQALTNTIIFFIIQVPIMIVLALLFAVALNDAALRFRGLFRTILFLPCVTSLIAYSSLLGPIGGIMIADYFFIRKQRLAVDELYDHNGRYSYSGGFNRYAIIALLLGILPNVPGFLVQVKLISSGVFPGWIDQLYHYAWFVGFIVSGIIYWLFMKGSVSRQEALNRDWVPGEKTAFETTPGLL